MSDLVGNPEDRFSQNEAQLEIPIRRWSYGPRVDQSRGGDNNSKSLRVVHRIGYMNATSTECCSQTCVKRPYKSRHVLGILGNWLLIAVWK